jgi:hypothetical protein
MHVKLKCVSTSQQEICGCNYQYMQKANVSDFVVKYYEQEQKVVAVNDNGNHDESVF